LTEISQRLLFLSKYFPQISSCLSGTNKTRHPDRRFRESISSPAVCRSQKLIPFSCQKLPSGESKIPKNTAMPRFLENRAN